MAETAALPASASVLVMTKESRSGGSEDTGRVPTRCVGRNLVTVRVRVAVLQHEMVVVNIGQSLGTTVADCQTQRRGARGCFLAKAESNPSGGAEVSHSRYLRFQVVGTGAV